MSSIPRVAVVIPRYAPVFGGAENQAALLNARLVADEQAHVSFVVTKRLSPSLPRVQILDSIPIYRVGASGVGRWSDYLFYMAIMAVLIRRRREYDLLHCHGSSLIGVLVGILGRLLRRPAVVKLSTHGELTGSPVPEDLESKPRLGLLQRLLAALSRKNGHLVALNREGEREVLAAGRGPYSVIPNGVDTRRFRPPSPGEQDRARDEIGVAQRAVVFVYTGRFVIRKGLETLLTAFQSARASDPDLQLVLVGSGALQPDSVDELVEAHTRRPGSGVLRFRGSDVLPFLHSADVFVFPSRREGLPNAVLEALAVGLPCILSDIPPHRELAQKNPAADVTLIPVEGTGTLTGALQRLAERVRNGEFAEPTSTALATDYDIGSVAAAYAALYRSLLEAWR